MIGWRYFLSSREQFPARSQQRIGVLVLADEDWDSPEIYYPEPSVKNFFLENPSSKARRIFANIQFLQEGASLPEPFQKTIHPCRS